MAGVSRSSFSCCSISDDTRHAGVEAKRRRQITVRLGPPHRQGAPCSQPGGSCPLAGTGDVGSNVPRGPRSAPVTCQWDRGWPLQSGSGAALEAHVQATLAGVGVHFMRWTYPGFER